MCSLPVASGDREGVLCDGEDETERTVQHDRGEQREAARGMASRNSICRVECSAAAPRASRSATWPGSSVPSPPGRAPDPGPPASLTADQPRAGGAADAGGGPVKPGQCPRIGGHPGHGQRHAGHVLGKLGAASHTESVARARVLSLIPTTAMQQRRARLHLGARCSPEDSTRHVPFRGTPGPPDLPSVRRTERTPEGRCAMATVKPGPPNGSTALTRTAAAPAS